MSKVLGFKEKDIRHLLSGILDYDNLEDAAGYVRCHTFPAVPLSWLENWCKEKQKISFEGKIDWEKVAKKDWTQGMRKMRTVYVEDLLKAARKQAGAKKEGKG